VDAGDNKDNDDDDDDDDDDDNDNNNNHNNNNTNKSYVGYDANYFDSQILQRNLLISNAKSKVMLPGFRREADEKRALLGYYAACCGDSLPVFPDILQVLSSRVNNPRILRNRPEGRNSQHQEVQTVTELFEPEDEDIPLQHPFNYPAYGTVYYPRTHILSSTAVRSSNLACLDTFSYKSYTK